MTQKSKKQCAGASSLSPQDASGSSVLDADAYQLSFKPPTYETLRQQAIGNLRTALRDLAATDNADAAKIYVEYILDAGHIFDKPRELLRSIEARLPKPTATQRELASVCRSNSTHAILFCRCIGAYGDDVLIAHADPTNLTRMRISKLHIPTTCTLRIQEWETAPSDLIDADTLQAERNQIPQTTYTEIVEA